MYMQQYQKRNENETLVKYSNNRDLFAGFNIPSYGNRRRIHNPSPICFTGMENLFNNLCDCFGPIHNLF